MTERIDICICTFRRPSVKDTLGSIAALRLPAGIAVRVIVADNDETAAQRDRIVATATDLGLDIDYVHAPARNISIARNACLAAANANWIAFIDDDEQAAPDWLTRLLAARDGADMVFGVSIAGYADPAIPDWVRRGDFHSNRLAGNDAPWNGYTANVLIDRRFVAAHALSFSPALGQIGGEDTTFFWQAFQAGARFGYADDAIVHEETPVARASLRWLALRRYRAGQVHYLLAPGAKRAVAAAGKALICFASVPLRAYSPMAMRSWALRGMLHAGVVASAIGVSPYREYGG